MKYYCMTKMFQNDRLLHVLDFNLETDISTEFNLCLTSHHMSMQSVSSHFTDCYIMLLTTGTYTN